MYKAVLCLLLLGQVILGDNDTKQSVEEEEDLGLGEQWAITDENLEKTEKEISHFVVFICKYRLFFEIVKVPQFDAYTQIILYFL